MSSFLCFFGCFFNSFLRLFHCLFCFFCCHFLLQNILCSKIYFCYAKSFAMPFKDYYNKNKKNFQYPNLYFFKKIIANIFRKNLIKKMSIIAGARIAIVEGELARRLCCWKRKSFIFKQEIACAETLMLPFIISMAMSFASVLLSNNRISSSPTTRSGFDRLNKASPFNLLVKSTTSLMVAYYTRKT